MSGHPSFSAQERRSRARPRATGTLGGHGPGHRMMPGEKPLDFKGTLKKHDRLHGAVSRPAFVVVFVFAIGSTVFNIVGPKVLSEATTVLFDGAVAYAPARLDRFRRHRPHPSGDVGPVPAVGGVLVGAVLGHGSSRSRRATGCATPLRKRSTACPSDISRRPPPATPSRASPTTWTRWARASTRASPRPSRRHHGGGRACHDALHQLDHDARGPGHGAGLHGARGGGGEALPEALRGPAAPARRAERPGGGDVLGPCRRARLRAGGRTVRAYEADNEALYNPAGRRSSSRAS